MREKLFITVLLCLLLVSGAATLLVPCASADSPGGPGGKPFVTIVAQGSQSYYLGEKVSLRGQNTDSDTTYLFITGPNLPGGGGKLTSPRQAVVSGSPDTFIIVKTKPDKTWDYSFYTANLPYDAGTYTLYAVSKPDAKSQFGDLTTYGTVGIILKKPFIAADLSSKSVSQGQPVTVSGIAEGIPPSVQIWILGKNKYMKATESVNPDASFRYEVRQEVTRNLDNGQYFVVVQHPMQNNQFNIDTAASPDQQNADLWVYNKQIKNKDGSEYTRIFKLGGPDSLQGSDAADALAAVLNEREAHDVTLTNDTYTILPFQVSGAGSPASQATAALTAPVPLDTSAGMGVTISVDGDQSYYLGEKVVFKGKNTGSDTTYLFITGPNLPSAGGKLTSPREGVASGSPDSFTAVKTKPDKTWEYSFYTTNLPCDAGTYSLYAVSQPKALDQAGPAAANVGIILKKPFLTAGISSPDIGKGQPFTITGTVEGDPPEVQVWIIGDAYAYTTKIPVNSDASFVLNADAAVSGKLPAGQNWLIVQHSMADNKFDIVVSGDYVRNQKLNNGTNLFKLTGPGSLQGSDAADALVAAFSNPEISDEDTYTVIPFTVSDTGSADPNAPAGTTAPAGKPAQPAPLQYAAPIGAGALLLAGIVLWKRQ